MDAGCEVLDLGVTPTPTVGLAIQKLRADGGLQITASHNPAPWNGLKMFGPTGAVLDARRGPPRSRKSTKSSTFTGPRGIASARSAIAPPAESWHRDRILELVDTPRIQRSGLRVFLDANGGAGGSLGRDLLASLLPKTLSIVEGATWTGQLRHIRRSRWPRTCNRFFPRIPACRADIGFVLDPDAEPPGNHRRTGPLHRRGADAVQKRTVHVVDRKMYLPAAGAPFGPTNGDLKRGLEFGAEQYREINAYCREKRILLGGFLVGRSLRRFHRAV